MKNLRHQIDLNAPGGLAQLFAANRALFGDATMLDDDDSKNADGTDKQTDSTKDTDAKDSSTTNDEKLGEGGLKALQAERDRAATAERKANELQAEIDKRDRESLTETEKAKADAQAAIARADKLAQDLLRVQAIADHGVPKDYQDLVTGTDAASFESSAKRIAELASKAAGGKQNADVVHEQGGGKQDQKDKSGGSLAAGRELYHAKHKKP